jgi:hypothetical protein
MTSEGDDDLSDMLVDDELPLNASLNSNLSNKNKTTSKHTKPILRCIVCGDNAYGKITFELIFASNKFIYFRIQFRCYFM